MEVEIKTNNREGEKNRKKKDTQRERDAASALRTFEALK